MLLDLQDPSIRSLIVCPGRFSEWQTPLCNRNLRHIVTCNPKLVQPSHSYMWSCMLSQYITIIIDHLTTTSKNSKVWARLTDDKWHVMVMFGILYVGCISLTIQRKCDLKAPSSEKMMINKYTDYSHIIREHLRKISFGCETIDD